MNKKLRIPKNVIGLTILILSSGIVGSSVFADNDSVVDQINITVPVSCTMSGTGMQSHNAEITNGAYQADIGTTTLHAFCNDNEGFAIYAAGYTGDEIGGTNSNKLVGTSASGNTVIESGIATSAGNPDISNWAMKLTMTQDSGDTTGTNAFTVDSAPNTSGGTDASFSQYHVVPNEYTKVAHKDSNTDMTASTGGVKLTTTYAAYISKTQPADTYSGQVKYTLVHPSTATAPGPKSLDTATTMQEVTYCADTLTVGQVYTLTDERDGNSYKVARLEDGNCWMLENLALDPTDSITATNMNSDNTNATTEAITNYLNGGSTTIGWSSTTVANINSDFSNTYGYTEPRINNESKNTLVTSYGPVAENGKAKVGIYYNYCAATVGTYCYDSDSGIDMPNTPIDATMDICPINWRMPTGGNVSDYATLVSHYSNTATESNSLQYNLSITLSGDYNYSSAGYQNSMGNFWSSTYRSISSMNYLYVTSTSVYPNSNGNRYAGYSVRCLIAGQ